MRRFPYCDDGDRIYYARSPLLDKGTTMAKKKARPVRKPWSPMELKKFKAMAGKVPTKEIARLFGRTPGAIAQKAQYEGVSLALKKRKKAK